MMLKGKMLALVLMASLALPGCMVERMRIQSQQMETQREMLKEQREMRKEQNYQRYRLEMMRSNLEREKAGMKAQPILSFEEWRTQP